MVVFKSPTTLPQLSPTTMSGAPSRFTSATLMATTDCGPLKATSAENVPSPLP